MVRENCSFAFRYGIAALLVAVSLSACTRPAGSPDITRRQTSPTSQPEPDDAPAPPADSRPDTVETTDDIGIDTDFASLVDAYNNFAFDLYARLRERRSNLFYSPFSIATALSMTYAGARTNTADQMADVLHLPGGDVHAQAAGLTSALVPASDSYDLDIANRLWANADLELVEDFRVITASLYDAEIGLLDFAGATEHARDSINRWVSDKTRTKIPELLAPNALGPQTLLVLTNAIYFKGTWSAQFDPGATSKAPFHGPAAGTVPLMYQRGQFGYAQTPLLQALRLPYDGGALALVVLLPLAGDDLEEVELQMSWPRLQAILDSFVPAQVDLWLPRFSSSSKFQLNETLSQLGMRDAFVPATADFSGIAGGGNLYISKAIHQAFVEINEQGSEAAAATAVVMDRESEPRIIEFRADRPFIYVIIDEPSGALLFVGRLVAPQD